MKIRFPSPLQRRNPNEAKIIECNDPRRRLAVPLRTTLDLLGHNTDFLLRFGACVFFAWLFRFLFQIREALDRR